MRGLPPGQAPRAGELQARLADDSASSSDLDASLAPERGSGSFSRLAVTSAVLLAGACCVAGTSLLRGQVVHVSTSATAALSLQDGGGGDVDDLLEVQDLLKAQEGGTCLLAIAVGQSYIDAATIAGRTKAAYAKQHGYRNLFFYFDSPHQFNQWCRSTTLGSKFQWEDEQWTHSTLLKYCALSSAIHENGCEKVLFTDADAMIVNFDVDVDLDWPGTTSKPANPHAMWSFAQWPEGFDDDWLPNVEVVPHDSDWCTSNLPGSCGSFSKFATCLNTGAFVMDNSQPSKDYIDKAIWTLLNITQKSCTTGYLNPWHLDQCKLAHGDQCIAACTIQNVPANRDKYGDNVTMPEEFMCLDTAVRPRLQEVFQLKHDYPVPHDDTFIVNCIGSSKVECICTIFKTFDHLSSFADDPACAGVTSAQRKNVSSAV